MHLWAWYIGIAGMLIFLSGCLFKNLFHRLVFLSLSIFPMCLVFRPISPYADYGNAMAGFLESKISQSYLGFLLLILFFKNISYKHLQKVTHAVCIFAVIDSLYCLFHFVTQNIRGGRDFWGLMDSSDSNFMALVFPLVAFVERKNKWLQIAGGLILIAMILVSKTTTAYCLLVSHGVIFGMYHAGKYKFVIPVIGVLIFFGGFLWIGPHFLGHGGRIELWQAAYNYFIENVNIFWGAGLGTFELFGPHIQIQNDLPRPGYFIWMHNDWLQILFECGAIGLLSTLSLYCMTIVRSIHRPYLACSVIGYGLAMLTQMPLHLFPTFFLGGLFMALVYKKSDEETIKDTSDLYENCEAKNG